MEQRRARFREEESVARILYEDRQELERELHFPKRYHEAKRRNEARDLEKEAYEFGRSAAAAIDIDEFFPSEDEYEEPVGRPHGPLTEAETRFNAGDTRPIFGPFSPAFYNPPPVGQEEVVVIKEESSAPAPIDTPRMRPAETVLNEDVFDPGHVELQRQIAHAGEQYINPRRFNRGGVQYIGRKRKHDASDLVFKNPKGLGSHSAPGWADFEEVHFRDLGKHPLGDYAHDEL